MADVIDKYKVPLFDGTNFSNWRFRMETLLEDYELLDVLKEPLDDTIAGIQATNATAEEKLKSTEAQKRKNRKCKSQIVQRIADSHLEYVKEKRTAYEAWTALTETFERKGVAGQLFIRRELLSLKFNPAVNSMEAHLQTFDRLTRDLRATGAKLEENDIVCHLLLTMPSEYDSVVTALATVPGDQLTVSFAKNRLRDEELRRQMKQKKNKSEVHPSVAFSAPGGNDKSRNYKRGLRCHACQKLGHIRSECRSKANGKSKQYGQRNAHIATENSTNTNEVEYSFAAQGETTRCSIWCLDSGASEHLVGNRRSLTNIQRLEHPLTIKIAKSGVNLTASESGDLRCKSYVNGKLNNLILSRVLIAPGLEMNLLSVRRLEMNGFTVTFKDGQGTITKGKNTVAIAKRNQKLYELELLTDDGSAHVADIQEQAQLWHKRLGHIGHAGLRKLTKLTDGIKPLKTLQDSSKICGICIGGKQVKLPHDCPRHRATRPLQLVHSDLLKINPTSYDNKNYLLTFIDDFTHFTVAFPLESKTEVFHCFQKYEAMATVHHNLKIARFRCDNGKEYISNQAKQYFEARGIQFEFTIRYTPQQNGVAERMNRTITEKARCMILQSRLPKTFWTEATMTAVYLINRSPTEAVKNGTPAELWYGTKPDLKRLRVFGCLAYLLTPKQLNPGKLDARSTCCIMLGYAPNGYRLWSPELQKIIFGRDIIFDETKFPSPLERTSHVDWDVETSPSEEDDHQNQRQNKEEELITDEDEDDTAKGLEETVRNLYDSSEVDSSPPGPIMTSTPRRSDRIKKTPAYLEDYIVLALNAEAFVDEVPNDYRDIGGRDDSDEWYHAVIEELTALKRNDTWTLTDLPPGKQAIKSRWVFRLKRDADGNPERYKARLVIKGCSQKQGIDYNEVYAPVARLTTVRTILSLINEENFEVLQLDVKNAFLHGTLQEEIYMQLPEGVSGKSNKVCKLNRAIYGLKQAPKVWNARFDAFVKSIQFRQSPHDPCLYTRIEEKKKTILLLYVDDIILTGNDTKEISRIKIELEKEFDMTHRGNLICFLGIKITRKDGEMFLSQSVYVEKMLNRFGMSDCKGAKTPMEEKLSYDEEQKADDTITEKPYRQLIGCLMFLMLSTRPDLSASVNYFSRFQSSATEREWIGLKRILRYVKQTADFGLTYKRRKDPALMAYADSDWAGSHDRKSTTGFLLEVYGNIVSWTTRKQSTVSLSSTEAEYVALATAAAEVVWLRNLLKDLAVTVEDPVVIKEDNQSCIHLLTKWEHRRLKHLDVKYHFTRDLVSKGLIRVDYIESINQKADILTKGLGRTSFERLRAAIGISSY